MQIILMEKVVNLGQLGDVVKVKNGYARNFLIPQGKGKTGNAGGHSRVRGEAGGIGKNPGGCSRGGPGSVGQTGRIDGTDQSESGGGWQTIRFRH